MTELKPSDARRRGWLAVLARASTGELESAARRVGPLPAPQPVRAAESGMIMLRGRVGGTGDAFNLGEASVTRSALRVGHYLGLGYVLGRDRRKSELVALFDALLQDAARQGALLREVVEPLARAQQDARERASREAAASRVEFFTMVRGET
jgi:alpha-D-ribose 1-methylphosphonate 5-triphosphate synthase subunit PhnG